MSYSIKWAIAGAITIALVLVIPYVDTLIQTKLDWSGFSPASLGTNLWDFVTNKSGLFFPLESLGTKQVFSASNILVNTSGWMMATIFVWIMTIIGLLNWRKFKNDMFSPFFWFGLIIHLSWFVVLYASEGARPIGGYLPILTDLAKIPFIGMGLVWTFNLLKYKIASISFYHEAEEPAQAKSIQQYNISRILTVTLPILSIMIFSLAVVSFQTVETRFTNLTVPDVEAAKYIAQTPGEYVVITDLFATGPIYTFSNGMVVGGGFPVDYIPGVTSQVVTNQFFNELRTSDDVHKTLEKAKEETGICTIHILIPSYVPYTDQEINRLVDNLGQYVAFGGKTKLFTYNACL